MKPRRESCTRSLWCRHNETDEKALSERIDSINDEEVYKIRDSRVIDVYYIYKVLYILLLLFNGTCVLKQTDRVHERRLRMFYKYTFCSFSI